MTRPDWTREVCGLGNVALVLKNHPELADEYVRRDSPYFDCPNASRYRDWLAEHQPNKHKET